MKTVYYRAPMPYPAVSGLAPNRKQALILMEGYSGKQSELTTVTQYAYHHLRCAENAALARTLKGIFLVETHHLELLGQVICLLGEDPRYFLYQNRRRNIWQAGYVQYKQTMADMLKADVQGEHVAAEWYVKTAGRIGCERISPLLLRLAEDEKLHYQMFSDLYAKYFS